MQLLKVLPHTKTSFPSPLYLKIVGSFLVAPSFSLQDAIKAAVAASILCALENGYSDGDKLDELTLSPSTDAYFLGPAYWAVEYRKSRATNVDTRDEYSSP